MTYRFWRRHIEPERQAARAEEQALAELDKQRVVEARWPEVRELSKWARETREANHLTELFLTSLRGGRA